MKKLLVFLLLLFLPALAGGVGNETINVLPDSNKASFRTDSQNFWQNETPDVLGRYLKHGFISSGGSHPTSSSCIAQPFSFEVFTEQGNRVTANGTGGSVSINYGAAGIPACGGGTNTVRVAACAVSGATTGTNWSRYGTTNIFLNYITPTGTMPPDCVGLMDVTITSGVITSVVPAPSPTKAFPFNDGVSIEETGGVCDGVTDNSKALQNALNIATGTGTFPGKVILTTKGCTSSAGYRFNTPLILYPGLEIDGNNATLSFGGSGSAMGIGSTAPPNVTPGRLRLHDFNLRSITSNATDGINISTIYDVIIDRVNVEGRAAGVSGSGSGQTVLGNTHAGIFINAASDVWVINSWIRSNKGNGVVVGGNNPTGVFISNNSIENNENGGFFILCTGGFVTVRDNAINSNGASAPEGSSFGLASFTMIGNVISSAGNSSNIVVIGGSNVIFSVIKVEGNTLYAGTNVNGIFVDGASSGAVRGTSISNNYINANVTNGILMLGSISHVSVVGNFCTLVSSVCVNARDGIGTTILKDSSENLVRKIAQGNTSTLLSNNIGLVPMFSAYLHANTLTGSGQIKVRSNWFYLNASGSTTTLLLVVTIGGTYTSTCALTGIATSGYRAVYLDLDVATQNSDTSVRTGMRCGLSSGVVSSIDVQAGGSDVGQQKLQTALVTLPVQYTEANTQLVIYGQHGLAHPDVQLFYQNVVIEGLGQ